MRRTRLLASLALVAVVAVIATLALAGTRILDVKGTITDGNIREIQEALRGFPAATTFHGGLLVTFRELGLGNNTGTNYVASGQATAVFVCVNNGNNVPNAENKHTVSGPVSATGLFTADKNGQVKGSIAVEPISSGDLDCPNGQHLALAQITYENITVTDVTNGVSGTSPDVLTMTFIKL
jgi:hypothetical protein